jgi:hypothetical protein
MKALRATSTSASFLGWRNSPTRRRRTFSTLPPGFALNQSFLPKIEQESLFQAASLFRQAILSQAKGAARTATSIPQPKETRSEKHNLPSEEYYTHVSVKDPEGKMYAFFLSVK